MCFRRARGPVAPERAAHEEVGLFSADRWGPGSLLTIGAFLGAGSLLLIRWAGTKGWFSLLTAALLIGGGVVLFAVKAAENIERVDFRGYDPLGKTGVVTVGASNGAAGSVRVDGLDWTATSSEALQVGEMVLVVGREGLHLSVRSLKKQRSD